MLYDVQGWVKNCQCCKTVKGPYTDSEPPQGLIVVNNPMDLLLIDFMKLDPSRNGKENVLVMTDAFSKFCVAVVTPNQKAKTVAKALIDKWFYTYGIPAHIHSDQGKSFDNHLIDQLCKLYGIQQSTTTLYNAQGNSPCEQLNCTLQNLLKMLSKDQKPNWPEHLSPLVFAYNVTPHSTTGYQPYQVMFGHKAPMPCDNWLGLTQYNNGKSISKNSWVQEQYELIWAANKRALKSIQQSTQKSVQRQKCKSLDIPEGNLVLLHDHPEGHNKIQDKYKETEYVMVFTGMWSQMFMTLNQLMVKAQCVLLTDVSYRILREPKKIKIIRIPILLIKGCKFPLIIQIRVEINHPLKPMIPMLLTQKGNLQHYP